MTRSASVASQVEVAVDRDTAFRVFTEELDLWWRRGPINFWSDAHRVVEVRMEPRVGGRIMEVLDRYGSDDVLVRGLITVWEPPVRVCWDSAVDDVATEVTFSSRGGATLVRVVHTVPAGGQDRGGTSWSRIVPEWFGDWVARRDHVPHQVREVARLSLGVRYARPVAAAHFLAEAFGFGSVDRLPEREHDPDEGHGYHWIEFRIGDALLHVFPLDPDASRGVQTHLPWIYVDDLAAHCEHARAAGARIVEEPRPFPGDLVYVAADLEGNHWRFSQARPTQH